MIRSLQTLARQGGILAGPLIVSMFAGLALLVTLYPVLVRTRFLGPDRSGLSVLVAAALIVVAAGVYRLGVRYKEHRFATGQMDPMMVRSFTKNCLARDLKHLRRTFETFRGSNQRLFFELLLSKAEEIARTEGLHLPGIEGRLPSSGREQGKRRLYRRLFQSASEYEDSGLPDEIALLKKASESGKPIGRPVSELIEKRKAFFTVMGDYQDLLPSPEGHTYFIRSTRQSAAVPPDSTPRIAFVLTLLEILDDVETDRIEPNRKKEILQLADDRIQRIHAACDRYQEAWQDVASASERMPPS